MQVAINLLHVCNALGECVLCTVVNVKKPNNLETLTIGEKKKVLKTGKSGRITLKILKY